MSDKNTTYSTSREAALRESFNDLLRQYDGVIRKVCYFYATDLDDFDDLRQEAMINLWRGFERFRGEARLSTWVYRVSLNSCVSYFRRHKRGRDSVPIGDHPELIAEDDGKAAMLRQMYRMINRLEPTDKAIILLWLDEHPYDEISDIMGLPRNTMASRLRRAKEKLMLLKEDC